VARLIGNPPINLLEAEFGGQNGDPDLRGSFGRVALDTEAAAVARNAGPLKCLAGLRAEHVRLACAEFKSDGPWRKLGTMAVHSVESLGDCTQVRFQYGNGELLTGRCDWTMAPTPGERVDVEIDLRGLHLFSADGPGHRLT